LGGNRGFPQSGTAAPKEVPGDVPKSPYDEHDAAKCDGTSSVNVHARGRNAMRGPEIGW
jgi:hypothetical protein